MEVTGWSVAGRHLLREAMERVRAEVEAAANEVPEPSGWSKNLLGDIFIMLAQEGAEVQLKAIRHAHNNGGQVSREEVFALGGYPDNRQLKGFTRPCNRVTQKLRDLGKLPDNCDELLSPIYPAGSGYSRALGFRIPAELMDASN